ncbi:hypothetical protein O6H91_13G000900 [Diphasiastrum complanatum]|nr:hypothetical protein O6H91_13G000900 [Diphasiastrum complanatum]
MMLRKKLPSSAALVQMKLQADAAEDDSGSDSKKSKPPVKKNAPLRRFSADHMEIRSQASSRESDSASERLYVMEEEKKMLRECLLAKRDKELQMGARTSSTLSRLDQDRSEVKKGLRRTSGASLFAQIQTSGSIDVEKSSSALSVCEGSSCNGDDIAATDTWTSALITQFSHLSLNKASPTLSNFRNLELMDDFVEMERLASTMSFECKGQDVGGTAKNNIQVCDKCLSLQAEKMSLEERLSKRQTELHESKQSCSELIKKLCHAEEETGDLQAKFFANERAMSRLQEKLDTKLERQAAKAENLVEALELQAKASRDLLLQDAETKRFAEASSTLFNDATLSLSRSIMVTPTIAGFGCTSAFNRVVRLVESLAQKSGASVIPSSSANRITGISFKTSEAQNEAIGSVEAVQAGNSEGLELKMGFQKLIAAGNIVLQDRADAFHFLTQLASLLELFMASSLKHSEECSRRTNERKSAGYPQPIVASILVSDCKVEELEEETKNMLIPAPFVVENDSISNCKETETATSSGNMSEETQISKLLMAAGSGATTTSEELTELKLEKEALEKLLDVANAEIESMKVQLCEAEGLKNGLSVDLVSSEESKKLAEDRLATMSASKVELQSQIEAAEEEVHRLKTVVANLEEVFHEEQMKHFDVAMECRNLQQQLSEAEELISSLRSQLGSTQESKEMAETQMQLAMASLKAELETKLKDTESERNLLQEELFKRRSELEQERRQHADAAEQQQKLQLELDEECRGRQDAVLDCKKFQQQLSESEQLIATLSLQLGSAQESKVKVESQILEMASLNAKLESQINATEDDLKFLQEKLSIHILELQEQRMHHHNAVMEGRIRQQKLSDTEEIISALQKQLAWVQQSKEHAEDQLASANDELNSRIQAFEAKLVELQEERMHHHDAVMKSQVSKQKLSDTQEIISTLQRQLASVQESKQHAEDHMASANDELRSQFQASEAKLFELQEERMHYYDAGQVTQQKLSDAEEMISTLQKQLASVQDSKQLAEDQLASANDELRCQIQAFEAQFIELQQERVYHHDAVMEGQVTQQKLSDTVEGIRTLQKQLAWIEESKQLAEDQLASANDELRSQIQAFEAKLVQVQEERMHNDDAVTKLQVSQQKLSDAEEIISTLQKQLASVQGSKQLAEDQLASANDELRCQIQAFEAQFIELQQERVYHHDAVMEGQVTQQKLSDTVEGIRTLQKQLAWIEESKQLAEDQLASANDELRSQIQAFEAKLVQVQEERMHNDDAVTELQVSQQKLSDAEEIISTLQKQLGSVQGSKQLAEGQLASANDELRCQIQAFEAQERIYHHDAVMEGQVTQQNLSETVEGICTLQKQLAWMEESKQLAEDQLASANDELRSQIQAFEAKFFQLQEERMDNDDAVIERQVSQQKLSDAEEIISTLQKQLASVQNSKQLAEDQLASANDELRCQIQAFEAQGVELRQERVYHHDAVIERQVSQQKLSDAEEIISTLQKQLGSVQNSKQLAEDQLASANDELRCQIQAFEAQGVELRQERVYHHDAVIEGQVTQQKLSDTVQGICTLQKQLAWIEESKQLAEDQLVSANDKLRSQIQAFEAKLQEERMHNDDAVIERQVAQQKLSDEEEIISTLHKQLAIVQVSKQLAEDQLPSATDELRSQIEAFEAKLDELQRSTHLAESHLEASNTRLDIHQTNSSEAKLTDVMQQELQNAA